MQIFFGGVYSCEHEHNFESQLHYTTQTNRCHQHGVHEEKASYSAHWHFLTLDEFSQTGVKQVWIHKKNRKN